MHKLARNKTFLAYGALVLMLSLASFACAKKPLSEKIAVRINDYTMSVQEFNQLFSELKEEEDTPKARSELLENLVNRKILLQEAQREKLDKQKDFLRAIENFWEQSLLKIIIDEKIKEVSSSITVTDKEIQEYYDRWTQANPDTKKTLDELSDIIRWQLLRQKQALVVNSWIEKLKSKANIKIDKKALGIE